MLLVDPYIARRDPMERKEVELYPSLGILTLAAWLRGRGTQVGVVDLTFERDRRSVGRAIDRFAPDVVGVHTKTMMFARATEIARDARRRGVFTVAGGPDSASRPEAYLAGGFDAVALGEGELTLEAVLEAVREHRPVAGLAGVVCRQGTEIVRGRPRPFLTNLDALPFPAWDLVDIERYLTTWQARTGDRRMAVLTSRGCPFDCSWCSKPAFGRTFRQQSPERVLAELAELQDRYGVNYVRFCDDVFGIQRAWLERLLDGMTAGPLRLRFECLARVDLLKPNLIGRMREAGLQRVYLGVESGSQKMLDLMNRGTQLTQVERAAAALRREGVRQFWFLMLGFPGEGLEDIESTVRLFRRYSPEEYSVSIAVPVPGTRFYEQVRARLRGERAPTGPRSGGHSLLYDAAYPEALYRWEQARFGWESAVQRARGRLSDALLDSLVRAVDRFHHRVATPLLVGGLPPPEEAEGAPSALPMARSPPAPRATR